VPKPASDLTAKSKPKGANSRAAPAESAPIDSSAKLPRAAARSEQPAERSTGSPTARITLSSRNYSSWSLRGWLLTRMAGLHCEELMMAPDDPDRRAELLLLSPSILVPMLEHEGLRIWDVLAIGEYLAERFPAAGVLPADRAARARCRSICGEIHSGFSALRSALPLNLRMRQAQFKVWSRAQADLERIFAIWRECLAQHGGPYLFGARSMADAMYAPVVTRLRTYDVPVPPDLAGYCSTILAMPEMVEWDAAALAEPDQLEEFDVEF
jgi:glutathione S-transferase